MAKSAPKGPPLTRAEKQRRERQLRVQLTELRTEYPNGLPDGMAKVLYEHAGMSRATYYRRIERWFGTPNIPQQRVRRGTVITQAMVPYFSPQHGRHLKDIHRLLKRQFPGEINCEYEQFTKIVNAYAPTDLVAALRGESKDGHAHRSRILEGPGVAGGMWGFDAKSMHAPINAAKDGKGYQPTDAFTLNVYDLETRLQLAQLTVIGAVTATHVLLALAMAIRNAGGIAHVIRCDNATVNLAEMCEDFVNSLRSQIVSVNSNASHENGRVEAPNRLYETYASTLPYWSRAPKKKDGKTTYGVPGHRIATAERITRELADIRKTYNRTIHSALRMEPLRAWLRAQNNRTLKLKAVNYELVAARAQLDTSHPGSGPQPKYSKKISTVGVCVTRDGIRRWYWSDYTKGNVDRYVLVRLWPDDPKRVELFDLDDNYVGTADINPSAADRRANNAHNAAIDRYTAKAHSDAAAATAEHGTTPAPAGGFTDDGTGAPATTAPDLTQAKRPRRATTNKANTSTSGADTTAPTSADSTVTPIGPADRQARLSQLPPTDPA